MKTIKILFFALISMLCTSVNATPADDLSVLLNSTRTMQANFTQTVYDNKGKAVQQSFGHMSLERPGKFRWEVTKPIPQVIIANGQRLWIYDPDLEQVTIRKLNKAAGETPALLLSDVDAELTHAYNVKPDKVNSQLFVLTPKSADNTFASIKISFVKNQLSEMRLEDHLGHLTSLKFQQIKTNVSLPSTLFVFKAPAKVDIIDETSRG